MTKRALFILLLCIDLVFAVLKDPELINEFVIQEKFDRSQKKASEIANIRESRKKAFLEKASIGGLSDTCLAYDNAYGNCLISANLFNARLVSYFPDSLELLSDDALTLHSTQARGRVFEELIDKTFLENAQLDQLENLGRTSFRGRQKADIAGVEAIHLLNFVKANTNIRVQVVAATDSTWLSSQYMDSAGRILPVTMPAWKLPDTIVTSLSGSPPGYWSPIYKVAFGYLTYSWIDPLPTAEYLEQIQFFQNRTSVLDSLQLHLKALAGLQNNPESCIDEDTLELFVQLYPPFSKKSNASLPSWKAMKSSALPETIKSDVFRRFLNFKVDTLETIRGEFGNWTIAKLPGKIKSGIVLDSATCVTRAVAILRNQQYLEFLRSEWNRATSKLPANDQNNFRTQLLAGLILKYGANAESIYAQMREDWVSKSLRINREMLP
jgi:hypothetical protein